MKFDRQQCFITDMLMAARAMKLGYAVIQDWLGTALPVCKYKVVIGTVQGDLHDIGKNLVAMAMKVRVDSAIAAGQYAEAVALIDTISKRYPLATDVRKSLIPVRAKAMEDSIVKAIPQLDLGIANLKGAIDTERAKFVSQSTSANFPPVLVYRGTQGAMTGGARIQARVSTGDEEELNPKNNWRSEKP